MNRIALRLVLGVVLVALFFVAGWNSKASRLSLSADRNFKVAAIETPSNPTRRSYPGHNRSALQEQGTVKTDGIRLISAVDLCKSCFSEQTGCENLDLCVTVFPGPPCQIPGTFLASVAGGTGPYLFSVTDPNGNPVTTFPFEESETQVTFTATKIGPYKVVATDAKGCRVTCSKQFHLDVVLEAPPCQVTGTFKVFVTGGTAPYSFSVTDPNGNPVPTSGPMFGDFGVVVATFVGARTGTYRVTVTDASGCQGEAEGQVYPCSTLTQSEWGKKKPKFNGEKRPKTIDRLFGQFHDLQFRSVLPVGVPGAGSRSVRFFDNAASCIRPRLPASGPIGSLPAGLGDAIIDPDTCQTSPPLPLVGDKFQNELLGQIIALTLNAGGTSDAGGLTPDSTDNSGNPFDDGADAFGFSGLWSLVLCTTMVTQAALPGSDGSLGTHDDLVDPGRDGILGTQDDPKATVTIPGSVINAIRDGSLLESLGKFTVHLNDRNSVTVLAGSVGRLLMLANLALAGETNLGGASLGEINAAVDAVNRAFDRCRFLISCGCQGCANLQIDFSPNPAPQSSQACVGGRPAWFYSATVTETSGIGINISGFAWDFYDAAGNLTGTQTNTSSDFGNFFNQCGTASTRIPPHGRACALVCTNLGGRNSGSVTMTFFGTDDNGNQVSFTSPRLVLLGS
jgi:hypothetical protein